MKKPIISKLRRLLPASILLFTRFETKAHYHAPDFSDSAYKKELSFKISGSPSVKNTIRARSFFIPSMMLAYGITTIKNNGAESLNQEVKEEIWTAHPHSKRHIDNYLQFAPAVAVYGLNAAGIRGKHGLLDRSMIYLISNVITNVTVTTLKHTAHFQRPDGSAYSSFPSGHTAEAFASAEFLRQEYKDVSPWYGIAGYAAASATGILRMYNNRHWLGDVVAGAGIGMASTKLAYLVYPAIKRKFFRNRDMNTFVAPYYQGGSAGVSVVYSFH